MTREDQNDKRGRVCAQTANGSATGEQEFEVSGTVRVTVVTYVRAAGTEEALRLAKARDIQVPGCAACSSLELELALVSKWVIADTFLSDVEGLRAQPAEAL